MSNVKHQRFDICSTLTLNKYFLLNGVANNINDESPSLEIQRQSFGEGLTGTSGKNHNLSPRSIGSPFCPPFPSVRSPPPMHNICRNAQEYSKPNQDLPVLIHKNLQAVVEAGGGNDRLSCGLERAGRRCSEPGGGDAVAQGKAQALEVFVEGVSDFICVFFHIVGHGGEDV